MSLTSERDNFKIKLFSGNEDDWEQWESVFGAVLFQKDLGEIVEHLSDDYETPKDDDDCLDEDGNLDTWKKTLKSQNNKAFAFLLTSINTNTAQGKTAFGMVNRFKDKTLGYKQGHFKGAYKALKQWYRPEDPITFAELKTKYEEMKMSFSQQPAIFISDLDMIR